MAREPGMALLMIAYALSDKIGIWKTSNFSSSSDVAPPRRVAELISTNDAPHLSSI